MDLRLYSDVILEPGMAFSLEPDLEVPGIGTFRHCNTIIVTENGCEVDSRLPRGSSGCRERRVTQLFAEQVLQMMSTLGKTIGVSVWTLSQPALKSIELQFGTTFRERRSASLPFELLVWKTRRETLGRNQTDH